MASFDSETRTDSKDNPSGGETAHEGAHHTATRLVHAGRDPKAHEGFVNTPVYRGSTVLFETVAELETGNRRYTYGRKGTPTIEALESAIAELEGGVRTVLAPSGLAAISSALLAFVEAGDHILVSDSVYRPTRLLCDGLLKRLGVETTYYDPLLGAGIEALVRENTRLVFVESPGSQTFEMQDIPAIAKVCRARGLWLIADNTWASPLYCNPFRLGVDVSIQAGTKYVVGHADAMLGTITANERARNAILRGNQALGLVAGSEEVYLALRGLRTLGVRLERHWQAALEMAEWLSARPEVARVLYPALESDPGHDIWRRDYTGASGLFSVILKPIAKPALVAFLESLTLFGMGYSWGGYESLVVPFDLHGYRTATQWRPEGPALRFHIGLEDVRDLKRDLARGFAAMAAATS